MNVLVAGASGAAGRHAVRLLIEQGHRVRAIGRRRHRLEQTGAQESVAADLTRPQSLSGLCQSMDAVLSTAGASLQIGGRRGRSGFMDVDYAGNHNLLAEARRAGVRRFVYLAPTRSPAIPANEYVAAHERFAAELASSGIESAIVRATGFFHVFASLLPLARAGVVPVVGDGTARTNPIHEADVAAACVEALAGGPAAVDAGGPEVFTRHRLAEILFDAWGLAPRVVQVPAPLFRVPAWMARPLHPRFAALVEFGCLVAQVDVIAPPYGRRRLGDYLRALTCQPPARSS